MAAYSKKSTIAGYTYDVLTDTLIITRYTEDGKDVFGETIGEATKQITITRK